MKKIVTGLVGVASHDESGGQRAGELLAAGISTVAVTVEYALVLP